MSGNEKSIKGNFIYNIIFQIITLIVPFITAPYVARVLGANNIGQYSYASALVSYFSVLAILGSSMYGQRCIAFHRDDKEKLSQTFWNIFIFRCITSAVGLIAYSVIVLRTNGYTKLVVIVALNIVNVAVDTSWFFLGIEDFKQTIMKSLTAKIIGLICVFVFVRSESDTWKYALIIYGTIVFGNLLLWRLLLKYVNLPKMIRPFEGFRDMWLVFLPTIAMQVYMILDKSMIGWITGSDYAIGCYDQSEKIVRASLLIVTSVGVVILPRVANLYYQNHLDHAKYYVYLSYRVTWMLALPIMFGMMSLSSVFIPLYLGPGYDMSIILLQIFSLLLLFVSLASVTGLSYLIPTKQQNVYTIAVSIAAVVNFLLNLILIRSKGAVGAAIASVIAEMVGTSILIGYCITKKQLRTKDIFAPSWKYIVASFAMFFLLVIVKKHMAITVQNLCILVVCGIVCYCIFLLVLRDDFFLNYIKKYICHIDGRKKNT